MPAGSARSGSLRVVVSALLLAAGLAAVVVLDSLAAQRELRGLLRDHAASLRQTVAAAARVSRAAATAAETQLSARLLAQARALEQLDHAGLLTQQALESAVRDETLFRASVYRPDATLALASATAGRPAVPRGPGAGAGLLRRLLEGPETQLVSDVHSPRRGDGARVAAGVRRRRGGAIVLNSDAGAVAALLRETSLDVLLDSVSAATPDVAYILYEQDGERLVHGAVPREALPAPPAPDVLERELSVAGRPVLELSGPLDGAGAPAVLRMGMRLDGVRRAERRLLLTLGLTLAAGVALSGLGVGAAWLRRRYALLSEEHARAEEALRRRDRLAAMGELASQVAHEVRNPLNAIAMSAQRLRREFLKALPEGAEDRQGLQELLEVVAGESHRIDRIVQQFLDYARPPRLAPEPLAMRGFLEAIARAQRPLIEARGIAFELDVSGAGETVADPGRLREAIENLLRNAVQATPAGGTIVLRADTTPQQTRIEVADTGAGIPPEQLSRIFDLHFTTKPDGTGVGLALTQQIVGAHGGSIDVDSRPGAGTRITLRLPVRPAEA